MIKEGTKSPGKIRLLVADIDGCLSGGSKHFFTTRLINRLAEVNALSRKDPDVPAITFCTGRPQPYVECLIQVSHGYVPALCESGTVFYDPVEHLMVTHPRFGVREEKTLAQLFAIVGRELICDHIKYEPGKVTHLTLLVDPPHTPQDYLQQAQEIAGRFGEEIIVETTRICIHFLFKDLHKGVGVEWLSDRTGILPGQMAGVGDSDPDLPFLRMMGLACAPANACERVKEACGWVSDKTDAEATLDFIDYVIQHNRSRTKVVS